MTLLFTDDFKKDYFMKRLSYGALTLLSLSLSFSCKSPEPKTNKPHDFNGEDIAPNEPVCDAAGVPLRVGTLSSASIAMQAPIHSIDPRMAKTAPSNNFSHFLFDSLDNLIEDVNVLPDQKTYALTLRASEWSNGDPVTAEDFVYSIHSCLDPSLKAPNAYHLFIIENAQAAHDGIMPIDAVGVSAIDSKTLLIKLEQPTPHFLKFAATEAFFPLPKKWLSEHASVTNDMPTNGPFALASMTPEKIVLKKNQSYWDKDQIRIDQLNFVCLDEAAQQEQFLAGQIDYIGAPFSNPLVREKSHDSAALAGQFIRINTEAPLFSHPKIRVAFSQAVNRERLANKIGCGALASYSVVPNDLRLSSADSTKRDAKQLFDETLLELQLVKEALPDLTFTFQDTPRNRKIAECLQQDWKITFGIDVALDPISNKQDFYKKLYSGTYQLALGSWMADINDPIVFLQPFQCARNGSNATGWENPKYVALLNESSRTADPIKRLELLHQAEGILLNESPVIPVLQFSYNFQTSERLKNVDVTSLGRLDLRDAFITKK